MGLAPKWPMSAYMASTPVTVRTTAPAAMNAIPGCVSPNASAWCGEIAPRISGLARTCGIPRAARVTNHSAMIGPKKRPTMPVPNRCTENNPVRTRTDRGSTRLWKLSSTTESPSIADMTEIAGVMTLSP